MSLSVLIKEEHANSVNKLSLFYKIKGALCNKGKDLVVLSNLHTNQTSQAGCNTLSFLIIEIV